MRKCQTLQPTFTVACFTTHGHFFGPQQVRLVLFFRINFVVSIILAEKMKNDASFSMLEPEQPDSYETLEALKNRLGEYRQRALQNGEEAQQLRSLLVAAADQIQTLSSKLDMTAPQMLETHEIDSRLNLPIKKGSEYSWMQSIVEELSQTKERLDALLIEKSELEHDLISRTRWARRMEQKAEERTRWAQASDLEAFQLKKTLLDHERLITSRIFAGILGPGDDPNAFLRFSKLAWKLSWPIRFVYRTIYRFFARQLWNPFTWPAWIKRMRSVYSKHGIGAFLGVTASANGQIDQPESEKDKNGKKK